MPDFILTGRYYVKVFVGATKWPLWVKIGASRPFNGRMDRNADTSSSARPTNMWALRHPRDAEGSVPFRKRLSGTKYVNKQTRTPTV
jgi:hypothetical protein